MGFKSRTLLGPANIYFLKNTIGIPNDKQFFSYSYPCQ